MRITVGRKLAAGFGIVLLLLAVLGVVAWVNTTSVHAKCGRVIEHDAVVMVNIWRLKKLVVDMETGLRGFCITRKEEFLEPYEEGLREFERLVVREKTLVADNPSQVQRLQRIESLVDQWCRRAAEPKIAMARKVATHVVDAEHLHEILRRGVGKELMDRIMALGHEIEVSFLGRGDWEGAFAVEIIEKCMADREGSQRGFLITGREEFLEKYLAGEQKKLPQNFVRLRAIASQRGREDELSGKIDQLEQLTREWTKQAAEPEIAARRQMNEHPESLKDVAALLEAGTGMKIFDQIRGEFRKLIKVQMDTRDALYAEAGATARATGRMILILGLAAVVLGIAAAAAIARSITAAVTQLARGAEIVGRGNLAHRIDVKSKDEFGQLASAFNSMVERRWQAEEREKHLNAVLRAIRNVNQLITKERDRDRLLQGACDELVETRDYHNCWIALLDESGKLLACAESGLGDAFKPIVDMLKKGELPRCGCAALEQTEPLIVKDPLAECVGCPLSNGYEGSSGRAVRLEHLGKVYGLLCVSVPTRFVDDHEEQSLFREVVGDISFALYSMELDEKRKCAEEALRESEEKFRVISDSALDAVIMIDGEGNVVYWNPAAERTFGYARDEIMRKNVHDALMPERYRAQFEKGLKGFMETGKGNAVGKVVELAAKRRDGTEFPMEIAVSAVRMKGQYWASAIIRDITERKRAEEALRQSEGKLRAMLQSLSDQMSMMDKDLNILWANSVAKSLFGDNIIGRKCYEVYHGRDEPCEPSPCLTLKAFADGQIHEHETQVQCRDGRILDYACSANVSLRDDEGNPTGVIEISRDITAQKQAERELRQSEERYRSIVDDVVDRSTVGVFILDSDFRVAWISRAIEECFGIRREDVIGKDKRELIRRSIKHIFEDGDGFARTVLATYDDNTYVESFECHVLPEGGRQERWLEHWSQPLRFGLYAGGRTEHYYDITERKQVEKQLRESQRLDAIGQLAAGVAHDFNNLLTGIRGYVSFARKQVEPDSEPHSDLTETLALAKRAEDLTRQCNASDGIGHFLVFH